MKRLVLPEGGDERIREAAKRIEAEGIAKAIVFETPPPEHLDLTNEELAAYRDSIKFADCVPRQLLSRTIIARNFVVR